MEILLRHLFGVTTDYDGDTRNAYWPYMGADEVVASPLALKLTLKALIEGFYAIVLTTQSV